jgi:predicted transport protein
MNIAADLLTLQRENSDNKLIRDVKNTGCPTRYRTRHFFNNSNTNEDITTKFEQRYVRFVRNEEECVCSVSVVRLTSSLVV